MDAERPPVVTPDLLQSIIAHPNLPKHTWYIVAASVLCVLNRPDEIRKVYLHAIEHGGEAGSSAKPTEQEQLRISRRMREALLKTSAIDGMPKTINAMAELRAVTPDHLTDDAVEFSPTSRSGDLFNTLPVQVLQRGRTFFNKVYGKVATRVMNNMKESGTPDLSLMAQIVYGYVLSNTNILDSQDTSYVMIAGLVPQDVNPQLKGHLKGALNSGATVDEVMAVRDVAIELCKAGGMTMLSPGSLGGWGWHSEIVSLR